MLITEKTEEGKEQIYQHFFLSFSNCSKDKNLLIYSPTYTHTHTTIKTDWKRGSILQAWMFPLMWLCLASEVLHMVYCTEPAPGEQRIRLSLFVQGLSLPIHTGQVGPQSPSRSGAQVQESDSCFKVRCTILCPLRTVIILRKPVRDRLGSLTLHLPVPNYSHWPKKITIYFMYINSHKETLER